MKLILAYMDYMSPSGFGSVSNAVISRMGDWCEKNNVRIDICASNFGNREKVVVSKNITAYNANLFAKNPNDHWYRDGFLKMLQSKPYHLVWVMNDIPIITPLNDLFKKIREQKKQFNFANNAVNPENPAHHPDFKIVFYYPVDSAPNPNWFSRVEQIDHWVTYTDYGQKETNRVTLNRINPDVIPHGFDTTNFYPINDKIKLRKKYGLPTKRLIYGCVNKNHARKDFGTLLIAYAKLVENPQIRKRAALYLHTYHSDPTGIKIHDACERLGLKYNEDYFLPLEEKYKNAEYTKSDMNEVYNLMDCFVTTSMAEGWGLTLSEAICANIPCIYGNHTAFKSFMLDNEGKQLFAVKNLVEHIQIFDGEGVRYKLNPEEVKEKMMLFFYNQKVPDYSKEIETYDWDKISNSWKSLFGRFLRL